MFRMIIMPPSSTQKMKAPCSSKMQETTYKTTRWCNLEDQNQNCDSASAVSFLKTRCTKSSGRRRFMRGNLSLTRLGCYSIVNREQRVIKKVFVVSLKLMFRWNLEERRQLKTYRRDVIRDYTNASQFIAEVTCYMNSECFFLTFNPLTDSLKQSPFWQRKSRSCYHQTI